MKVSLFIGPDSWVEPAMKPIVQFSFLLTSKGDFEEVRDVSGTINIMTYRFSGSAQFSLLVHEGCFLRSCAPQSEWKHGMFDPFKVRRQSCCFFVFDY